MAKIHKSKKENKRNLETKVDLSNAFKELRDLNKTVLQILKQSK